MNNKAEWAVIESFVQQNPDMVESLGTILDIANCIQGHSETSVVVEAELCAYFGGYIESTVIRTLRKLLQDPGVVDLRVREFGGPYALAGLMEFAMQVRSALRSEDIEQDRARSRLQAREIEQKDVQEAWAEAV